ncbi:hypothetical protein ACJ4V0_15530 [Phreatobacter sp. HK31-P]
MASYSMSVNLSMNGDLTGKAKQAAAAIKDMANSGKMLEKLRADRLATDLDKSRKSAQGLAGDLNKVKAIDLASPFSKGASAAKQMQSTLSSLQSAMSKLVQSQHQMNAASGRRGNSWAEREARAMERLIQLQSRASLNYQRMSSMRMPSPAGNVPRTPGTPGGRAGVHVPRLGHRTQALRHETLTQAGSLGHERALMRANNIPDAEVDLYEANARRVTQQTRYGTVAEGLKMQSDLRMGLQGNGAHAREFLGTHMQLDAVIKSLMSRGAFTHGNVSGHDFTYDAVRAAELSGATATTPRYEQFMDSMLRASVASRGRVNPTEMHAAMRHARASAKLLSPDFIRDRLPELVQQMGGHAAGTMMRTMQGSLVGGRMQGRHAQNWHALGLVPEEGLRRNSRGGITGIQPNGMVNSALLASNPYEWVQQHLMPALAAKGITGEADIRRHVMGLSGDPNTVSALSSMSTTQAQFEGFRQMIAQIGTLGQTFATLQQHDPTQNFTAFRTAWEDMLASLASPLIPQAISAMQSVAALARGISNAISGRPDDAQSGGPHPSGGPTSPGGPGGGGRMGADSLILGGAAIATTLIAKRALGSPTARRLMAAGLGGAVGGLPGAAVGWTLAGAGSGASGAGPTVAKAAAGGAMRAGAGAAARAGMRFLPGIGWVMLAADGVAAVNTIGEANAARFQGVPDGAQHDARQSQRRRANAAFRDTMNEQRAAQGVPQMAPLSSTPAANDNLSGQGAQVMGTFQQGAQAKWGEILGWWQSLQLPNLNMRPNVTITPNVSAPGLPGAGAPAGGGERPAPSLLQRQSHHTGGGGGGNTVHVAGANITVHGTSDPGATARGVSQQYAAAVRGAISDVG